MTLRSKTHLLWLGTAAVAACPLLADYPGWWATRNILSSGALPDDYAACNQGQLKNFARGLAQELDSSSLEGGAGPAITALISSWDSSTTAEDYALVNQGQLKAVASLFYQRFIQLGLLTAMPASLLPPANVTLSADSSIVNLGQLKSVFSVVIPSSGDHLIGGLGGVGSNLLGNGNIGNAVTSTSLPGDADADGILDLDEDRFGYGKNSHDSEVNGQSLTPDAIGRLTAVGVAPGVSASQAITLDSESNVISAQ